MPSALPSPSAAAKSRRRAAAAEGEAAPPSLAENLERFYARLSAYLKPEEVAKIGKAYACSEQAHRGQSRISGDPYITHPLAVASTLADWHLDAQAVIAGLLHDVMEDTGVSKPQIAEQFGKTAAELVDGVSKLDKIENQTFEEAQAENFRKMLLAMARDVRVILIKLADRLHNMRTLDTVRSGKRRRIARETLEIYAPIANRLGLNTLYRELQEMSFKHLYPMRYRVLEKSLQAARGNRRQVVGKILEAIKKRLPTHGIEAEIMGREKHHYGIYRKMREKHLAFSQVYDIFGCRVVVKDVPTCYLALGALHSLYKPVPGKFKDYIAIPKANGYQSLHTTLMGPYGMPVEIQIRTREMHYIAESGVASHWLYKDDEAISDLQRKTHKWLQSLLDLQSSSVDSTEFLEHVKVDLFPGEVYAFTPRGKIFALPRGATAVDFAYAVHTDIGDHCVACRINLEPMPLRTELKNGDRVEIITAPHASPNPAWLSYVKSARARAKIRHYLKTQQVGASTAIGERLLGQSLRRFGLELAQIDEQQWGHFLRACGLKSKDEIYTDIGLGKRLAAIVARRLAGGGEPGTASESQKPAGPILIRGTEGVAVQLARCCRPIPGDPIVGTIRKGQGLVVHTHDCPVIARLRSDRTDWVDVEWESGIDRLFEVSIRVLAQNQRGVLAKLAAAIAEAQSNIINVSLDEAPDRATTMYFTVEVGDRLHLARVMRGLRQVTDVIRIARLKDSNLHRSN